MRFFARVLVFVIGPLLAKLNRPMRSRPSCGKEETPIGPFLEQGPDFGWQERSRHFFAFSGEASLPISLEGGGAHGTIATARPPPRFPAGRPPLATNNVVRRAADMPAEDRLVVAGWHPPACVPSRDGRSVLQDYLRVPQYRSRAFRRPTRAVLPTTAFCRRGAGARRRSRCSLRCGPATPENHPRFHPDRPRIAQDETTPSAVPLGSRLRRLLRCQSGVEPAGLSSERRGKPFLRRHRGR